MGVHKVRAFEGPKDRAEYMHRLMEDLRALELMLEGGFIESGPLRIGAEQELFLVDSAFMPDPRVQQLLEVVDDEHFTTEIGKYNLEVNLDPVELGRVCLQSMRKALDLHIKKVQAVAESMGSKVILTGILPTLNQTHTASEFLTPVERYAVLNKVAKSTKGSDFQVHIHGLDEVTITHESVLLEACNTSFQVHLQTTAEAFVPMLNWANAISGPVLAACVNSPLLFGKELWQETRVALFSQSVDIRANSSLLNDNQPRVSFDRDWHRGSPVDVFRDQIARFKSILSADLGESSLLSLERGEIPKLKALCLHNGTVYRWNRPCFGVGGGKPHLRIECRYIPSGPTVVDEIANLALWIGVMNAPVGEREGIEDRMDFRDVRTNFLAAARYGLDARQKWGGNVWKARDLVSQVMIPMAKDGLVRFGITPEEADYYLSIIQSRVDNGTGAEWSERYFRKLTLTNTRHAAAQLLTAELFSNQEKGDPVGQWEVPQHSGGIGGDASVRHLMQTDVFTVDGNDPVELAIELMKWKNIHHLPVIQGDRQLLGIVSMTDFVKPEASDEWRTRPIADFMKTDLVEVSADTSLEAARSLMLKHHIHCLPVVDKGSLIGIITTNDL